MTGGGFYEQRPFSPTGFGIVVALHAAALGTVVLTKGTQYLVDPPTRTEVTFIPLPTEPPPLPPPPDVERPLPRPSTLESTVPIIRTPAQGPPVYERPADPPPFTELASSGTGTAAEMTPVLPPLRIEAQFDPRFAAIQPPYPSSEQRAQREGNVRVRVTIGTDGRVKAVQRLSATSDAFWQATERYARSRWRFRPATEDGRPVESTKVLNLHFQIEA
ncbi:MAG: energy transducer TonB [Allosphingosinicella sp.]